MAPSPARLHDGGRFTGNPEDASGQFNRCKSLLLKALSPQVVRHQPVSKSRQKGFKSRPRNQLFDRRLTIGRTSRGAAAPRLSVQAQPFLSGIAVVLRCRSAPSASGDVDECSPCHRMGGLVNADLATGMIRPCLAISWCTLSWSEASAYGLMTTRSMSLAQSTLQHAPFSGMSLSGS
jgi:hypothetical protein